MVFPSLWTLMVFSIFFAWLENADFCARFSVAFFPDCQWNMLVASTFQSTWFIAKELYFLTIFQTEFDFKCHYGTLHVDCWHYEDRLYLKN